jgi:hypothetical protein
VRCTLAPGHTCHRSSRRERKEYRVHQHRWAWRESHTTKFVCLVMHTFITIVIMFVLCFMELQHFPTCPKLHKVPKVSSLFPKVAQSSLSWTAFPRIHVSAECWASGAWAPRAESNGKDHKGHRAPVACKIRMAVHKKYLLIYTLMLLFV